MVSDTILSLIIGAVVGIASVVASLVAAVLSIRSTERALVIQLQSDESKRAIATLHKLFSAKNSPHYLYASDISQFLDSMDSAYLPNDVREWASRRLREFWDEQERTFPDDAEFSSIQAQVDEQEYQAFLDNLDPDQRREEEFRKYRERLGEDSTRYLRQALTGRPRHKLARVKNGLQKILQFPRLNSIYRNLRKRLHRKSIED